MSSCVWLISCSRTCSRFICVVTNGRISFFVMKTEIPLIETPASLSVPASMDPGCVPTVAVVKNAAVNKGLQRTSSRGFLFLVRRKLRTQARARDVLGTSRVQPRAAQPCSVSLPGRPSGWWAAASLPGSACQWHMSMSVSGVSRGAWNAGSCPQV